MSNKSFSGPHEVSIYQAITLKAGLRLLKVGIKPNRQWSIKNVLATVSHITGGKYSGKNSIDQAINDLTAWIDAQKG